MAIRSLKSGTFSRSTMVGNPIIMPGSFESIASVDVGAGGASTITFSSIPSTYTHLQIRIFSKDGRSSSTNSPIYFTFNSDGSSNYSFHQLGGDGAVAFAQADTTASLIGIYSGAAVQFGAAIVDVLDYANTNKNKTTRTLSGTDQNGGGTIWLGSGNWRSTSAISSITFTPFSSPFAQYTSFALYGVN